MSAACDLDRPSLTDAWQAEADAHGAMGKAGTFDVDATTGSFTIAGDIIVESVALPFQIINARLIDAELEGVGTGTIDFTTGGSVNATEGTLAPFNATASDQLGLSVVLNEPDGVEATGLVFENASAVFRAAADPAAAPLELVATPDAPIVVTRAKLSGGSLIANGPDAFTMTLADFGVGGAATAAVSIGDVEVTNANAVFARDVSVTCGAVFDEVSGTQPASCAGEGNITQVVVEGDVVIDADVEVQPIDEGLDEAPFSDALELEMAPGEARHIVFAFRERSYSGDAVVTNVAASGDGADVLQVAAAPPEGTATTIIGRMQADGTIDAGETVVLVVAGPAIVLVDTVTSIVDFFDTSAPPPTPFPIPSWIQAGQVGSFTVVATIPGGANNGDRFPIELSIEGANFETQTLAFTIVVDD